MSDEYDVLKKFFGYVLKTIGALIMLLTGLCSAAGMVFVLAQPSMLFVVLLYGGLPFGIGWLLWVAGGAVMPKTLAYLPRHSIDDPPPPSPPLDPPSKPPTVS